MFRGAVADNGSQRRQHGHDFETGRCDISQTRQTGIAALETGRASATAGKVAAKPDETKKADVADAGDTPAAIPASVANANAQLTSTDVPADSASAMSAKASTMLVAATDKPADAQAAADTRVVSSDQLNDVDRALQQNPPPSTQTVAMAVEKRHARSPGIGRRQRQLDLGPDLADRQDLHRLRRLADDGLRRADVHGVTKCRHCEPTGRREAPPDDRLREAIHRAAKMKHGLLRRYRSSR